MKETERQHQQQASSSCMSASNGGKSFILKLYIIFVLACLLTILAVTHFATVQRRIAAETRSYGTPLLEQEPRNSVLETRNLAAVAEEEYRKALASVSAKQKKEAMRRLSEVKIEVHNIPLRPIHALPGRFLADVKKNDSEAKYVLRPWRYHDGINENGDQRSSKYFVTYLIKSAIGYVDRRFVLRRTWGSLASVEGRRFGLIFLLGACHDEKKQDMLRQENDLYGDILQSDVSDTYHALPEKVLSGFQYLVKEVGANGTDYVITTDDDCYVNAHTVYDYFSTDEQRKHDAIHCGFSYDATGRPIRNPKSKWYMPYSLYSHSLYPPFCHGGMVVLSYYHVEGLYNTHLRTNHSGIYLEDVLIFGILRQKIGDPRFRVVPYGYDGSIGRRFENEPLVFHLDHSSKMTGRMVQHWQHTLHFLQIGGEELDDDGDDGEEEQLGVSYPAKLRTFPVLPDKSVNETVRFFKEFWTIP